MPTALGTAPLPLLCHERCLNPQFNDVHTVSRLRAARRGAQAGLRARRGGQTRAPALRLDLLLGLNLRHDGLDFGQLQILRETASVR